MLHDKDSIDAHEEECIYSPILHGLDNSKLSNSELGDPSM